MRSGVRGQKVVARVARTEMARRCQARCKRGKEEEVLERGRVEVVLEGADREGRK